MTNNRYKREFELWKLVDDSIGNGERYRFGDYTFSYWPSEAAAYKEVDGYGTLLVGKGCKRRIWYRYHNTPVSNPMGAEGWYKAMMGKVCETFIFDSLQRAKRLIDRNIKFYNKRYNISGEVDALVRDDNANKVILELKTIDGWFATKGVIGYKGPDKQWVMGQPKDDHLLQAFLYDVLNNDTDIKYVKIIYFARDTTIRTEFDITHTKVHGTIYPVVNGQVRKDIDGTKMLERYDLYNLIISQETPPERDYTLHYDAEEIEKRFKCGLVFKTSYEKWKSGEEKIGDFYCAYCPYKDHCWRLGGK